MMRSMLRIVICPEFCLPPLTGQMANTLFLQCQIAVHRNWEWLPPSQKKCCGFGLVRRRYPPSGLKIKAALTGALAPA